MCRPDFDISQIWRFGFTSTSLLNETRLGYVARYSVKKQCLARSKRKELKAKGIQSEFSLKSRGLGDDFMIEHFEALKSGRMVLPVSDNSFTHDPVKLTTCRRFKKLCDDCGFDINELIDNVNLDSSFNRQRVINNSHGNVSHYLANREKLKVDTIQSLKRGGDYK